MDKAQSFEAGLGQLEDLKEMIRAIIHPSRRLNPESGQPYLDFTYGQWCILYPDHDYSVGVGLEPYIPETYQDDGDQSGYLPAFGLELDIKQDGLDLMILRLIWALNDLNQVDLVWVEVRPSFNVSTNPQLLLQGLGQHWVFDFLRQVDNRVFEGDLFRRLSPAADSPPAWRFRGYFERFFHDPYRQLPLPLHQLLFGMMTDTEQQAIQHIEEQAEQDIITEPAS